MKISIAQINTSVGDINGNFSLICQNIEKAISEKSDIVVFPELTITGYPPKDLLYDKDFVDLSIKKIHQLAETYKDICIIVGGVRNSKVHIGRACLYNSAFIIKNGEIDCVDKTLLPNYSVFDENRYFVSADAVTKRWKVMEYKNYKFIVTICEDIWTESYDTNDDFDFYKHLDFDLMINISSSPFSVNKMKYREEVLFNRWKEIGKNILYVNQVGGQDDLVFDGSSLVCVHGNIKQIGKSFVEDFVNIDVNKNNIIYWDICPQKEEEKVYKALVLGIRDYFKKSGFKKALIGLSGGVDSALVAVLAADALGSENVTGILMPSKYSSDHSINDALALVNNLGIDHRICHIAEIHSVTYMEVQRDYFDEEKNDLRFKPLTDQNMQARIRGQILMMLSNETGALVLSTGNKSECAVGYCTLYGDMCGGINVLGDVYKTTVYKVCDWINRDKEIIPKNTLVKAPSAELAPNQKDSDDLPDYNFLDRILKLYIEENKTVERIIQWLGLTEEKIESIKKVIKKIRINEYKRQQAAPMIIISDRDLINARRIPIVNGWW